MNLEHLRLLLHPEGDEGGGDAGDGGFDGGAGDDAGGDPVPSEPAPDPITFEAGALVQGPGMEKPITWGEKGPEGFIPQSEYTRTRQQETAELKQLREQAERHRQERAQFQQWQQKMLEAQQQPNGNGQAEDPRHAALAAAEARGGWMHVNDIRQILEYGDNQLGELRQMIEDAGGTVRHLAAGQQNVVAAQQAINKQRAEQALHDLSTEIISANPVLKNGDEAEARAWLQEIYDSYQPGQNETRESFLQGLRDLAARRLESSVNLVQSHQKATRSAAQRARIPGPSSNPPLTGDGKPITDSAELAEKLWSRFGGGGPQ